MFPLYDEKTKKGIPFVTIALVVFNLYFFFISFSDPDFYFNNYAFSFRDLFNGSLYTILTSMFLHGSILHLLGNMLFLWVFGRNIESKIGSFKFIVFYLLCGIISVLAYALMEDRGNALIGASGAISGVLGAYLILFPRNKIRAVVPIIVFWTTASIPAFVFIIIWFVIQLLSLGSDDMVAYSSHIGGFIAGMLLIKKFVKR
ncbi:MAG: rhomboid family intramembrane serine protease [Candidatus Pacebacteria bacterium]|nr:rhomboid family intramembrane serine protease [Candidatus Paceibacterota bacterium]MDD5013053.1 rhomboid family intramembrane serine protease [Candidatus Paceibacterota bacterium]MDD5753068.1 rhomboid family intramembrane serine protease [Candidatus Paceibacterota bacterium]